MSESLSNINNYIYIHISNDLCCIKSISDLFLVLEYQNTNLKLTIVVPNFKSQNPNILINF